MLANWRVTAAAAVFCTGLLITCIETSAQSIPKDVAARTEIYAIPSLTISDQQFLSGDASGSSGSSTTGASSANATGGSDFANQGRGALDDDSDDDDSTSGLSGGAGGSGSSGGGSF